MQDRAKNGKKDLRNQNILILAIFCIFFLIIFVGYV